ncbi:MAG: SWIM zinc finger family protein [Gemmatimonadaceae bacterium]|nr:SWIM zinc finger family protein [Gloeobacterales cyanobacterium ES-bin-141]
MNDLTRTAQDGTPKTFASQWWAQRWIDVLESFGWTMRLARGRNYARGGNVLEMELQGPKVVARVQGTAPEPYNVSLALDQFDAEQWEIVIETMVGRAIFAAKLLAGEMPQNIEEAFTASGLSLFPFNKWDIHSHCSCPDKANPCKHIAAVYYLLGERFDQDPFVLFALRGRTRAQIVERLRELRGNPVRVAAEPVVPEDTSPLGVESFWQLSGELDPTLVVITPPPTGETVLNYLGLPPVEATTVQPAMTYLQSLYRQVSDQAASQAMGVEDKSS